MINEGFHFDFDGVRDLFVVVEEDLLADDLVDEETFGLVGELVLGEESGSFGQGVLDGIEELGDAETLLGGDGEDLSFRELGVPEIDEALEGVLRREVYLIYYKEHARTRGCHLLHFLEEVGVAVGIVLNLGDVEQNVGVHEGGTTELQHLFLELVVRREDAGRVRIDHLEILAVDDAHDTMAGGLRLGCDDGQTLADEGVHQGGFADVGVAYDIYKTAFMHQLKQKQ